MSDESSPSRAELEELRRALRAQEARLTELARQGRRRRRGSLAHVAGYAAVLVVGMAASAGALAGANTVFSDDITDGNVKTADLAANAVVGGKVKDNSLTGADVNENALNLGSFFAAARGYQFYCSGDSGPETCAQATLTLTKPANVLLNASGYAFEHTASFGTIRLVVDGVQRPSHAEFTEPERENWGLTDLVELPAGEHTFSLLFDDGAGDIDAYEVTLTAVQVNQ